MTVLTLRGERLALPKAGQPMHILAGHGGLPTGLAAMQITIPPLPRADPARARRIRRGNLRTQRTAAGPRRRRAGRGTARLDVRGTPQHQHGFSNPSGEMARVLDLRAPAEPALAFMRDVGVALTPDTRPDPDRMREIYARQLELS